MTVKVDVRATDERVTILGYDPPSITVQLDPLVTKTVPVQVDYGSIPPGLQIRDPVLSATEATRQGPDSVVRLVTAAQARVVIQPSGIDVDQTVDLVAVDARGEVLRPVVVEPSRVHVSIAVGSGLRTEEPAGRPDRDRHAGGRVRDRHGDRDPAGRPRRGRRRRARQP